MACSELCPKKSLSLSVRHGRRLPAGFVRLRFILQWSTVALLSSSVTRLRLEHTPFATSLFSCRKGKTPLWRDSLQVEEPYGKELCKPLAAFSVLISGPRLAVVLRVSQVMKGKSACSTSVSAFRPRSRRQMKTGGKSLAAVRNTPSADLSALHEGLTLQEIGLIFRQRGDFTTCETVPGSKKNFISWFFPSWLFKAREPERRRFATVLFFDSARCGLPSTNGDKILPCRSAYRARLALRAALRH